MSRFSITRLIISLILLALPSVSWASRGFNTTDGVGSTDAVTTTTATNNTNTSWCVWAWRTANTGLTARVFAKDDAGIGVRSFYYDQGGTVNMFFQVGWSTTDGAWTINEPSAAAWHQFCITYNGGATGNAPVIYVDGASVTVTLFQAAVGTLDTSANPYIIGNRDDGLRVWDGRIAEFAFWEGTILSAANVTTLWNSGGGLRADSPTLAIAPTFYMPLCGAQSPESNAVNGASTGVLTGTKQQAHPFANCGGGLLLMGVGQ